MFKVNMLPARHGDCLWIEYGEETCPNRILIDTGPVATYELLREKISRLPPDNRCFELLIVTHVDADHIEGALPLLQDRELGVSFKDIWFNGWKHFVTLLGPVQGEMLSGELESHRWNGAFGNGGAVVVPQDGRLPQVDLAGGMKVTLISPDQRKLDILRPLWQKAVERAGLEVGNADDAMALLRSKKKFRPISLLGPQELGLAALASSPFVSDAAAPNGSSIAILAEFEGKKCLFAADAHSPLLERNIDRLNLERGTNHLELDAFKISHHGSKNNTSKELLEKIACNRYLISTDGGYFGHPDDETIARIIANGRDPDTVPALYFNYLSESNRHWADPGWMKTHRYEALFPEDNTSGFSVFL